MPKPRVVRRTRRKPSVVHAELFLHVEVDANKAIGVLGVEGGESRLYAILKDHGVYVVSGEVTTRF